LGGAVTKRKGVAHDLAARLDRARVYRGLRRKVVEQVEHEFEEGVLFLHIRFTDKTELCWQISTRLIIEKADLTDWKTGDFKQLKVFVRNERDRSSSGMYQYSLPKGTSSSSEHCYERAWTMKSTLTKCFSTKSAFQGRNGDKYLISIAMAERSNA
jgi:hypothetical protein